MVAAEYQPWFTLKCSVLSGRVAANQGLPLVSEAEIEEERNGFAETELLEMGMSGIEEEIGLRGDDDAGDPEDGRGGAGEPGIADSASGSRRRIGTPVLWKRGWGEPFDEMRRDGDGDGEIVAE